MNQGMQERMRIESGLRHALGNGELLLHYQPKFEIGSDRIVGAEALVRWRIRSAAWCRRPNSSRWPKPPA
jgi:sensor c-di-GMP phosphodiesterase-like protein